MALPYINFHVSALNLFTRLAEIDCRRSYKVLIDSGEDYLPITESSAGEKEGAKTDFPQ